MNNCTYLWGLNLFSTAGHPRVRLLGGGGWPTTSNGVRLRVTGAAIGNGWGTPPPGCAPTPAPAPAPAPAADAPVHGAAAPGGAKASGGAAARYAATAGLTIAWGDGDALGGGTPMNDAATGGASAAAGAPYRALTSPPSSAPSSSSTSTSTSLWCGAAEARAAISAIKCRSTSAESMVTSEEVH